MEKKKSFKRIQCINCGMMGHTAKKCNEPVTSYGIICCKWDNIGVPRYLMIQKRDSLCYVEFLRGKYELSNRDYLIKLFTNMTNEEKARLLGMSFDDLWHRLWADDIPHSRKFQNNYLESKSKFDRLRGGYYLKEPDSTLTPFNLATLINISPALHEESEWEFPKGRRQLAENDMMCALREFEEETGVCRRFVHIYTHIKPLEEIFMGMNRVRYRHVYYIGVVKDHVQFVLDTEDVKQTCEVKDMRWCTIEDVMERTRIMYVERKELFLRAHRNSIKEYEKRITQYISNVTATKTGTLSSKSRPSTSAPTNTNTNTDTDTVITIDTTTTIINTIIDSIIESNTNTNTNTNTNNTIIII
jgi:8-oxo-dGTP pyrophosphatase MutT (NUDIX family)